MGKTAGKPGSWFKVRGSKWVFELQFPGTRSDEVLKFGSYEDVGDLNLILERLAFVLNL